MNYACLINKEVLLTGKALKDEQIQEKKEVAPGDGATFHNNSS